jgi:hypothetical protein
MVNVYYASVANHYVFRLMQALMQMAGLRANITTQANLVKGSIMQQCSSKLLVETAHEARICSNAQRAFASLRLLCHPYCTGLAAPKTSACVPAGA